MTKYHPTVDKSSIVVPPHKTEIMERIAVAVHDLWAAKRLDEGWKFGEKRDGELKTNPNLVPYDCLPEEEKQYDREIVAFVMNQLEKIEGHRNKKVLIEATMLTTLADHLEQSEIGGKLNNFNFRNELQNIKNTIELQFYEATVFYVGRFFECLLNEILKYITTTSKHESLAISINQLSAIGLMEIRIVNRSHALRKLANNARHGRVITKENALNSVRLLDDIFTWLFRLLDLPRLRFTNQLVELLGDMKEYVELRDLVAQDSQKALEFIQYKSTFKMSSGLRTEFDIMEGLCLSRLGRHTEAIKHLELVKDRLQLNNRVDDELLGILGGAYKRRWQSLWSETQPLEITQNNTRDLMSALKFYRSAYGRSGKNNTYVGINIAALQAWRNEEESSIQTAFEVIERLPTLDYEKLKKIFPASSNKAGLWSIFTRAEAKLLIGLLRRSADKILEAEQLYEQGLEQGATFGLDADCRSALKQMRFHLDTIQPKTATNALVRLGKLDI